MTAQVIDFKEFKEDKIKQDKLNNENEIKQYKEEFLRCLFSFIEYKQKRRQQ